MAYKFRFKRLCAFILVCLVYYLHSKPSSNKDIMKSLYGGIGENDRMAKYPSVNTYGEVNMKGENTVDWMKTQEDIQHQRLSLVKQECTSTPHMTVDEFLTRNPSSVVIDPVHRLMYCRVPKIASTSWQHMLLIIGGYVGANIKMDQYALNKYAVDVLPQFVSLNKTQKVDALQSYTKFIFVRHPFSRVLSVFKNKLDPNSKSEHIKYFQQVIGMKIIKKYRTLNEYNKIKKKVDKNYDLKFGEFVKYVGDSGLNARNAHWNAIYDYCHPCTVTYNFIGKMETISEDTEYLMKQTKLDEKYKFPSASLSSPTNSTSRSTMNSYYKDIPVKDLKNLYKRFKVDFKLFGYPEPDYVNGKIIPG